MKIARNILLSASVVLGSLSLIPATANAMTIGQVAPIASDVVNVRSDGMAPGARGRDPVPIMRGHDHRDYHHDYDRRRWDEHSTGRWDGNHRHYSDDRRYRQHRSGPSIILDF